MAVKKKLKAKSNSKSNAKSNAKSKAKLKPPTKKASKSKNTTKTATPKTPAKPAKKVTTNVALVPSRDGVLVQRVEESDRTPGGLYIPTTALEKPLKGVVVGTGKGRISKRGKLRPLDVQPGDQVLFGKFAGTEITINGKDYLLVREDEILGVVS